jgi:hypothetical protein
MKRRRGGFGYESAPKARAREIAARAGAVERLGAIERQKADAERDADDPLPNAKEAPREDTRSVAQKIGLGVGLDLDAELDRRRLAMIADPASIEHQASSQYAQRRGEQHSWAEDTTRLYALFLRSVDLPRPRQTSISLPKDRRDSDRPSATIMTHGRPGSPPEGWALFEPARIDAHLVLGLEPSQVLTGQQWAEAARRMDMACRELEASGCLEWQDRGSRGLLKL